MLLVYSGSEGPRWKYIAQALLGDIAGVPFLLTHDREAYLSYDGPCLNYSTQRIRPEEILLVPSGLLEETGVTKRSISTFLHNGHPCFFPVREGDLPFDLFSAAFWLLSRYEEYLPHGVDRFGRYDHTQSLAFREGFLNIPVVSIWAEELRMLLTKVFPMLQLKRRQFRFMPTYDIDIAFSYLHKGTFRNTGGWIRSILKGKFMEAKERVDVLQGKRRDPFDVYEWLDAQHLAYGLKPQYFFLLAEDQQGLDKNIHPSNKALRSLISHHSMGYPVGIHPSWQSGDREELLGQEIETLERISGKQISSSRQHYLRFTLPGTYRRLIAAGISGEFSMGYGTVNGFRASVSDPFLWYDLSKEESTNLRIHPFCYMDSNSVFEQKDTPAHAFDELSRMHELIKKLKGTMVTVFHNNILGDDPRMKGWREVYEVFMRDVVYWDI